MPGRQRLPLIAGGLLLAYSCVRFLLGFFVAFGAPVLGWVPLPVMALLAAHQCRVTSRQAGLDGVTRRFWRHLALCCVLLSAAVVSNAADALRVAGEPQRIGPVTSLLYVAILMFAVWALFRLPAWRRTPAEWLRFWLDTSVIVITTGILIWHFSLSRAGAWAARTGSWAVAEGVETAAQAHRLHQAGYRYAQGFHFARPMSGADVGKLLRPGPVPA